MRSIEIEEETYQRLQKLARPFEDSPESIVTALLDHFDATERSRGIPATAPASLRGRTKAQRASVGQLLPEREYWVPILRALEEHGGIAPAVDVIERVGELLADRLTEADRDELATGGIRWRKRTQFARLRMAESGLLSRDVPRGVWAITERGRARIEAS